jgi:hypothetical protein
MRVVGVQVVAQYLLEEGLCVDVVLLVDIGHCTMDGYADSLDHTESLHWSICCYLDPTIPARQEQTSC